MRIMKNVKIFKYSLILCIISMLAMISTPGFAQEEEQEDRGKRPVRPPFESTWIMEQQTSVVPSAKTMQFDIQHRFGTLENGLSDLYGMWASSNIRLGMSYSLIDDLAIGVGTTKFNKFVDFNLKWNFLKQRRDWSIPVSLTYYGYVAVDTRNEENFDEGIHRLSYLNELIISVRVSSKVSLQLTPSYVHFNAVDSLFSNDIIGLSFNGRVKLTPQSSIIFDYTTPLTKHDKTVSDTDNTNLPLPNIGIGWEISTSTHAFQIFFQNYQEIMIHKSVAFNSNDFSSSSGWLLGFNITRLWGF